MGNENSLSKGIKGPKRVMDKFDCKIISTEYNSDYNGVKTCTDNSEILMNNFDDEKENEKSRLNLSTECSTADLCEKEIKLPTKFEWKEGGNVVFLTGSFNNWSQWFIMNRVNANNFDLVLDLPLGSYQYKFIVDKIWKFSRNHPTALDGHGNINNIIENSRNLEDLVYKTRSSDEEDEAAKANSKKQKNNNERYPNNRNQKLRTNNRFQRRDSSLNSNKSPRNDENSNYEYSCETIPAKQDMNMDANNLPRCYTRAFNINNYHVVDYKVGKHDFVKNNAQVYGNTNSSYAKTPNLPLHINIVHSGNILKRNNVLTVSSSFRAKNKHFTIVYYKPFNH